MRTVNGVEYPTFRAACVAMNLIEDDRLWHDCLQEATLIAMPSAIRVLFCNMLVQCAPADHVAKFWNYDTKATWKKKN